jgi:hypothetical protein
VVRSSRPSQGLRNLEQVTRATRAERAERAFCLLFQVLDRFLCAISTVRWSGQPNDETLVGAEVNGPVYRAFGSIKIG